MSLPGAWPRTALPPPAQLSSPRLPLRSQALQVLLPRPQLHQRDLQQQAWLEQLQPALLWQRQQVSLLLRQREQRLLAAQR